LTAVKHTKVYGLCVSILESATETSFIGNDESGTLVNPSSEQPKLW